MNRQDYLLLNSFLYNVSLTIELAIGLALMSGILPKIVIFGMFVPFNLTLPFLPPTELLGHLPIFAAMYVLLFLPPPQEEQLIDETEKVNHTEIKAPLVEKERVSGVLAS